MLKREGEGKNISVGEFHRAMALCHFLYRGPNSIHM